MEGGGWRQSSATYKIRLEEDGIGSICVQEDARK